MTNKEKKETNKSDATLDNIYKMLKDKKAPAEIGKPIYAKDFDWVGGSNKIKSIVGQRLESKSDAAALPLNFGCKQSTGYMPDDVRLRLYNFKKTLNNVEIQAACKFPGQYVTPDMMKQTPIYKNQLEAMCKAFNVTDFSNWIPTVNSRFFFEELEIPFLLNDNFNQQPMDSATVEVPGTTGHLEGFEETDDATFTSQSRPQANYTVTSRNNVVHAQITQDLMVDSAPSIIENLRQDVGKGVVRSYENCTINGDTTGTPRGNSHQDSDTQALALNLTFSKAFDGLRKKAFANDAALGAGTIVYDHGSDTASKALFENVMGLMGKFASEKDDLIWLLGSTIENQLVTGAIPELFTAFAFGGLASNVTGQVPPVFGIKVVTSEKVREDLNNAGVFDNSVLDKTSILLVKKSRFNNFIRQAMRIFAAPSLPSSDIMLMTAKMRHAWNGNPQSADEKSVVMGRNIALTT